MLFCVIGKGIADYFFCKGTAQPYLRSPCKKAEQSRTVKLNSTGRYSAHRLIATSSARSALLRRQAAHHQRPRPAYEPASRKRRNGARTKAGGELECEPCGALTGPERETPQKAGRDIEALGRARHPERAHEKKQGRRSRSCNPCFFESGCYGDGGRP